MLVSTVLKLIINVALTLAVWKQAQGPSGHKRATPPGSPQKAVQMKKSHALFVCVYRMLNFCSTESTNPKRPRCSTPSTLFSTRLDVLLFHHVPLSTHVFSLLACQYVPPIINPNLDDGNIGPLEPVGMKKTTPALGMILNPTGHSAYLKNQWRMCSMPVLMLMKVNLTTKLTMVRMKGRMVLSIDKIDRAQHSAGESR